MRQRQLAASDESKCALHVLENAIDVDAAMPRPVRPQASRGLLELAFTASAVPAGGMQPRDGDMDETLQEVALCVGCLAPLVLELLVRLEVLARADEIQTALEPHDGIG